jgi:hypothetical protein
MMSLPVNAEKKLSLFFYAQLVCRLTVLHETKKTIPPFHLC